MNNFFNHFLSAYILQTQAVTREKLRRTLSYKKATYKTFYAQHLRAKIPKAQKDTYDFTVFLNFWDLRA